MGHIYAEKKRPEMSKRPESGTAQQPSLDALRTGAAMPTQEQMGRRVDLPDAMREKMENAFSADLSSVKLYESSAVRDAGAEAITQGSNIAFAPGLADFSGYKGQLRLGHELSHVVSQARGDVTGSGFLNDPALESRADREGAMAASGQQIAMPTAPLSPASAAAAAGPMQAWGKQPKSEDGDDYSVLEKENEKENKKRSEGINDWGFNEDPEKTESPQPQPGPAAVSGNAQVNDQDPWHFKQNSVSQDRIPSRGGLSFVLGMNNEDDTTRKGVFQRMLQGIDNFASVKRNRQKLGGQMAYNAMRSNSYAEAIRGMEAYRDQLLEESKNAGFFEKHFRKERVQDRARQLEVLNGLIAGAKADKEANFTEQSATITDSDRLEKVKDGGQINDVAKAKRDGVRAFFKPDSVDANHNEEQRLGEASVMDRIGIKHHDENGNPVDPHTANREIAYARLCSLLGSSVGIEAKHATIQRTNAQGDQTNVHGVLMEEAPGEAWTAYHWNYFGAEDELAQNPMDDASSSANATRKESWGDRLDKQKKSLKRRTTRDSEGYSSTVKVDEELDAADPDFQRQMNEMFLIDTLATYTDRHAGNFKVGRDNNGKISVKAIDDDISFGSMGSKEGDEKAFGKRGESFNYGGLPRRMQIDAGMAEKIEAVTPEMLQNTFADLLSREEIDALGTRFEMMKKYIQKMREKDDKLIVKEWNEETAKKELRLAGGVGSFSREKKEKAGGGFSGNNYYQRQMLSLRAAERGSDVWKALAHGNSLGGLKRMITPDEEAALSPEDQKLLGGNEEPPDEEEFEEDELKKLGADIDI